MWNTNVSFSFWLYTFAPVAFYVCGQRPILLVVDVVVHIHGADLFSLSLYFPCPESPFFLQCIGYVLDLFKFRAPLYRDVKHSTTKTLAAATAASHK